MQTEQHRHSQRQGYSGQSRGPEMFYGYCHDTGTLRMMDYTDYVNNMQTTYSNLYRSSTSAMQPMLDTLTSMMRGYAPTSTRRTCRCGSHDRDDCGCECCIRCADLVEYVRCGEVRQIPITFENDTRRERDVKLEIGAFVTDSGQDLGWKPTLSETTFRLPACGEKTITLTVNIDCAALNPAGTANPPTSVNEGQRPSVESCKVAYGTLRGEGCIVRPLVIAIAILPNHCSAHHAGCQCSCCCN